MEMTGAKVARRIHLATGIAAGVWLLLMAATGVLINHQEALGLHEVAVPNRFLPAHYADEFHPESNPLGVIIADIHSGRFLGESGIVLGDLIALLLAVSVCTGAVVYLRRR